MSKVRTEIEKAEEGPLVRIGELARRAGIPPATLRAWERRYGVITPRRGDSGYRLYSEADEQRVRRMTDLIASGLAPAEAARRIDQPAEGDEATTIGTDRIGSYREGLGAACARFDDRAADAVLDQAIAVLSIDALLNGVLLPVLRDLENETIGQEHFASNLIRGRLLALARGWGGGEGRRALLACPEGEHHDIGLIAFGLSLRARGWRIGFLGQNTPVEAVMAAAEEMRPDAVVLSALTPEPFVDSAPPLSELGRRSRLHLAGPGAREDAAARAGATVLVDGPVEAAAALAA